MNNLITTRIRRNSECLQQILAETELAPIFAPELMHSSPYYFDFTRDNPEVTGLVEAGGESFQRYVDRALGESGASWGIGRYLERRDGVLEGTFIGEQGRYYHLGVDVAFPADTPLFAPMDGQIYRSGYADEWGDYGNWLAIEHELDGIKFYLFFGHLKTGTFRDSGPVRAGERLALLGDFHENGQWYYHTHLQICFLPWEEGTPDGYASEENLETAQLLNPDPTVFLRNFV